MSSEKLFHQSTPNDTTDMPNNNTKTWIRGVNLGGWLVLERYITPYLFALTDCHLQGTLCRYLHQSIAPSDAPMCASLNCTPYRTPTKFNNVDYPLDEYTLARAFRHDTSLAEDWLNPHFAGFITRDDLVAVQQSGLTHVRVPLPHWILDKQSSSNYIVGDRYKYLIRLLQWCRELGIQVWPDLHTSTASQNGFDNSGHALTTISCRNWSSSPKHVNATLAVIDKITRAIQREGYSDVVTGFGLLNEPFKDCDTTVYETFVANGIAIVRRNLGPDTNVYISDLFQAPTFNRNQAFGSLLQNSSMPITTTPSISNTVYLDSHYYHVFNPMSRKFSPRQHIAYVCTNELRDASSCCKYMQRMVGEWSVGTDALPIYLLNELMNGIAEKGSLPMMHRALSHKRQEFLRHFAQAQMVAYESAGTAWFYWNIKMQGGAFAEWDYLRGIKEQWIPRVPAPNVTSESLYGTCYDIMFKTDDNTDFLNVMPDPATVDDNNGWYPAVNDDVVLTHGESLHHFDHKLYTLVHYRSELFVWIMVLLFMLVGTGIWKYTKSKRSKKKQYESVGNVADV
jgi:glucan 1,3-beta-glucosidase